MNVRVVIMLYKMSRYDMVMPSLQLLQYITSIYVIVIIFTIVTDKSHPVHICHIDAFFTTGPNILHPHMLCKQATSIHTW